jgi:tripartite ATP-independent transporter DctM subunit
MLYVIIVFVVSIIIGVPIAFVIGLSGAVHVWTLNSPGFFGVFIERLFNGVANSSYLCIPFFILAGELLSGGGITKRLLDFIRELIGFVKGGLAYALVIVAACLSAILGSTSAVVSILCSTVTPELIKDGYDEEFAVSLAAAGGILGPIIPPGTTMVILAVATQTSVRSVFFAGIMPGILIAISFGIVIAIKTKKRNYPKVRNKFSLKDFLHAFKRAGLALLVPFVIIFGVIGGVFTPAEAGAAAVAVSLICGLLYRTLTLKDIWKSLKKTVGTSAGILIIVSFGNVLGWSFAIDQIPAKMSAFVTSVTSNPTLIMGVILLIMFALGFVIEGYSAVIIFGPVFGAIAAASGVNMVYYCIMFIVIVNIGLLTPPVGMALFVASDISRVPLTRVSKSIFPFVIAAGIATILMWLIPNICLWIPNLLVK